MKFSLLLSAALCFSLSPLSGEEVILRDDFRGYQPEAIQDGSEWGAAIPGTSLRWHASSPAGSQAILSAADAGAEHQTYQFEEKDPTIHSTYSFVQLSQPCGGDERGWSFVVEFQVQQLENPGVLGLAGLYQGTLRNPDRLTTLALIRNSVTGGIQVAVQRKDGSTFLGGALQEGEWYRLTVTGQQNTFDVSIAGPNYSRTLSQQHYSNGSSRFDLIAIGDSIPNKWAEGRQNSVRLRLVELTRP